MATPIPMDMPKVDAQATLEEMRAWMLEMYTWHQTITLNGIYVPAYTQQQLDDMEASNDKAQVGKMFYNNTINKFIVAELVAGNLALKTITTT